MTFRANGETMSTEGLVEEYLSRAEEAQHRASRCADADLRISWQKLAESYRKMAQWQRDYVSRGTGGPRPHSLPADNRRGI